MWRIEDSDEDMLRNKGIMFVEAGEFPLFSHTWLLFLVSKMGSMATQLWIVMYRVCKGGYQKIYRKSPS